MNLVGTLLLLLAVAAGLGMLATKRLRAIGLVFLAIGVGGISFFMWQSAQRNAAFDAMALGVSTAYVAAAVGSPPRVTDGTEWVESGYKRSASELIPGCVREYWYSSFLFPEKLSFCFNSSRKLIHKYRYTSW